MSSAGVTSKAGLRASTASGAVCRSKGCVTSLTQPTQSPCLAVGAFLGGTSVAAFGFAGAFLFNAVSFLFSALCISRLRLPGRGFRPARATPSETDIARPWHEYKEGLRYMRERPLILGIGGIAVGWATGGGAA